MDRVQITESWKKQNSADDYEKLLIRYDKLMSEKDAFVNKIRELNDKLRVLNAQKDAMAYQIA